MCNPMAVIMAAQSAAQISAANQAAESAQVAAVERQQAMNAQRQLEMEQANKKAALEMTEEKREALREQAAARVAAAESGVAGVVNLRNIGNVYMQESFDTGSIAALNEAEIAKIGKQSESDFLVTRSAINEAEAKKTTGIAAALQIGASAAQGYATGGGTFPQAPQIFDSSTAFTSGGFTGEVVTPVFSQALVAHMSL